MKNIRRFFLAALALILCVMPLATAESAPSSAEPPQEKVLAENKVLFYSIVYAQDCPDSIKTSVSEFYNAYKTLAGGGVANFSSDEAYEYDAKKCEILIGDTAAPESREVMKDLAYGDYCIRFAGNKLVVAAYSRYALDDAITALIQLMKKGTNADKKIAFAADIKVSKTVDAIVNQLPRYDTANGSVATLTEGDDTSLAIISGTEVAEYDWYLSKLEAMGYRYHTSNTIGDNYFATYYNDDVLINAGYYGWEKSARITIETKTATVGLKSENQYTAKEGVKSSVSMMGLCVESNNNPHNGMAYAIQLADGSFIIVDGGFYNDAARLYGYLRSLVPEGKINIAAWFITHNDGDHSQCMSKLLSVYKDELIVDQVVTNFPASRTYGESGTNENTGPISAARDFPGCKVIKAHTGYRFYIRNAVVEILFSLDNFLPDELKIFNNSSLVFTVEIGGERILFTGDASDATAGKLIPMYGSYLKSDILQLAHHGLRNGHGLKMPNTEKLYAYVRPEIVLWPTSTEEYLNVENKTEAYQVAVFTWNCVATDSAREVYIAGGDEITVLELPYRAFSAVKVTDWMTE